MDIVDEIIREYQTTGKRNFDKIRGKEILDDQLIRLINITYNNSSISNKSCAMDSLRKIVFVTITDDSDYE